MKSSIFIPKTINVGYQKRSETYTGKLAYVIYYDQKGKLRKETSWNNWRDKNIPNDEFDNIPIEGFVLNKKAGDCSDGWNHRQAYCRVYDPRGFEFEITIENLLYILENTNCIKGKGLEGEFIYGWDGKDLVLLPLKSPDYKQIKEYNDIVHNNQSIKAKDLIVGATYLTKDNSQWVYMGRFDTYGYGIEWFKNGKIGICKSVEDVPSISDSFWSPAKNRTICNYPYGKMHWFAILEDNGCVFEQFKNIQRNKLIQCIDEKCTSKYPDLYEKMESSYEFSPVNDEKDEIQDMTWEEFYQNGCHIYNDGDKWYNNFYFISSYNGQDESCFARVENHNDDKFILNFYKKSKWERGSRRYEYVIGQDGQKLPSMTLREIYDLMKPKCIQKYLANGRKFEKEYIY